MLLSVIFLAGPIVSAFVSVPHLNLPTSMFAASMMVHLRKMIARQSVGRH